MFCGPPSGTENVLHITDRYQQEIFSSTRFRKPFEPFEHMHLSLEIDNHKERVFVYMTPLCC
jgi:hypothetical protein